MVCSFGYEIWVLVRVSLGMAADSLVMTSAARTAMIRERQRDLYGAPLRTVVYRIIEDYGISQARLAGILGISPALLSLLVTARRSKICDPVAHTRLMVLDQRRPPTRALVDRRTIESILTDVARIRRPWPHHTSPRDDSGAAPSCLISDASPQQLEAAAARVRDEFPAVADMLRRAAHNGRT